MQQLKIYFIKKNNKIITTDKKSNYFLIIDKDYLKIQEYKKEKQKEFLQIIKDLEENKEKKITRIEYKNRKERKVYDKVNNRQHIWSFTSKYKKGNAKQVRYSVVKIDPEETGKKILNSIVSIEL